MNVLSNLNCHDCVSSENYFHFIILFSIYHIQITKTIDMEMVIQLFTVIYRIIQQLKQYLNTQIYK